MFTPLVRRLESFAWLLPAEKQAVMSLGINPRMYDVRQDLISEGGMPTSVFLILKGLACRYKLLADGQRQITAYLLPGDLSGLNVPTGDALDHSVGALSTCLVAQIPRDVITSLIEQHPGIGHILGEMALVDEAILNEWLVNVGRRSASQRIAHLFCELLRRNQEVGLVQADSFEFPLTQQDIGDTMALSTVHVNRTLQNLRRLGLIRLEHRRLAILDRSGLEKLASFNPNYLHLAGVRASRSHLPEGGAQPSLLRLNAG